MKYFSSQLDKLAMSLTKSMIVKSIMRFAEATISEKLISSTVMKITKMMEKESLQQWRSKTLTYWS